MIDMTMTPEERRASARACQAKYHKENSKMVGFRVMFKSDADILERLEQESNGAGFIKQCIREHIMREKESNDGK